MSKLTITLHAFANAIRDPATEVPLVIAPERLQVYQQLFFNNIKNFIDNAFPVLHSLYPSDAWLALQRQFFKSHVCHSPYFLDIAEQFVHFVQRYPLSKDDPVFLAELAHYEWVELYISTKKISTIPTSLTPQAVSTKPLALSELALLAAYHYPVQHISQTYQPTTTGDLQCFLIYRNPQDDVIFVNLNHASLVLLHQLQEQSGQTFQSLIKHISPLLPQYTPEQLIAAALPLLQSWAAQGAIVAAS